MWADPADDWRRRDSSDERRGLASLETVDFLGTTSSDEVLKNLGLQDVVMGHSGGRYAYA